MLSLLHSLYILAAQTTAPAEGEEGASDAAASVAGAAAQVSEEERQRALEAGLQAQEADAGHGSISLMDMIREVEPLEQGVMLILLVCTVYALMLLFEKIYVLRKASKQTKEFVAAFRKANSVEEAEAIARKLPASGIKAMFDSGMAEVRRTQDLGLYTMRDARDHTMQRVQSAMASRQNEHIEDLSSNMTFLASIGANAPFIGLFGTVWGIMMAFIRITETQTTSLAVVAGPIGGALLATAMGLVAAIPAVLIYNFSAKQISKQSGKMEDFSAEFVALVSRDMDRRTG